MQEALNLERYFDNLLCGRSDHYSMEKNVQKKAQICIVLM